MSLDVTAASSIPVNTVVEVATNTVRVTGIAFNFDDNYVAVEVSFGVLAGGFTPHRSEMWIFSGTPLTNFMLKPAVGATRNAVIREMVSDIVSTLQTTQGLKQQLIDGGNLTIAGGSLLGGIAF